jgi:microcin C transport system permease protein
MWQYALKRFLLIIPTLLGILLVVFTLTQFVPGGPVEQAMAELRGKNKGAEVSVHSAGGGGSFDVSKVADRAQLEKEQVEFLRKQFGFDKPFHVQFFNWLKRMFTFDFGESYFRHRKVLDLIIDKLPVSMSLGIPSFFLVYLACIPLGIGRALKQGTKFDAAAGLVTLVAYATPGFVLGLALIVLFCGGNFLSWFPIRGLTSDNWADLSWGARIWDYTWHLVLPLISYTIASFAVLTVQTRNLFLEEMNQQYVQTARAKGMTEKVVLFKHVFRNAMIIIISGIPAGFVAMFFAGSLLIENLFSLDGLGLLMYEAVMKRDYPIVIGELFLMELIALTMKIVSDMTLVFVDPRISFDKSPG